jgi:hypothetical protein
VLTQISNTKGSSTAVRGHAIPSTRQLALVGPYTCLDGANDVRLRFVKPERQEESQKPDQVISLPSIARYEGIMGC